MAPRTTGTRERPRVPRIRREEVRRRILASAGKLFKERGLEATSLEAVAEDAGFSKGAIYSNFAGKDELCFELLSSGIDARIGLVESSIPADADPELRAGLAGDRLLRVAESEPGWQIFFVELWLRCVRNPTLRSRFAAKRRLMRAQIARLLEVQSEATGQHLTLPAEHLATSILALSNGLGMEGLIDREAVPPDLLGKLLGWTLKGMLAEGAERGARRAGGPRSHTAKPRLPRQ